MRGSNMEALLMLIMGAYGAACFVIGAKVGQKVVKGESIEMPKINPMERIQEHRDKKQAEKEQERIDTILRNIDRYDGTGRGQEDVPRG
jgi:hypothetical protein